MENTSIFSILLRNLVSAKPRWVFSFLLLGFLGVSCSNQLFPDEFIPLNAGEYYHVTSADSVQLFVTQLPTRPYREIGLVYVRTRSNRDSDEANKNLIILKQIAAKYGANAVIRLDVTDFNIKGVVVSWK